MKTYEVTIKFTTEADDLHEVDHAVGIIMGTEQEFTASIREVSE